MRQNQSWTQRTDWWLPRRRGLQDGWIETLGLADADYIYRTDKKKSPTVQQRELYSIAYNKSQWKKTLKINKYIYGSLCCRIVINATL